MNIHDKKLRQKVYRATSLLKVYCQNNTRGRLNPITIRCNIGKNMVFMYNSNRVVDQFRLYYRPHDRIKNLGGKYYNEFDMISRLIESMERGYFQIEMIEKYIAERI